MLHVFARRAVKPFAGRRTNPFVFKAKKKERLIFQASQNVTIATLKLHPP